MKIRRLRFAGFLAASLWPAAPAHAEMPTQVQIEALLNEAKQKNSGPLAEFAGLYDLEKTCRPLEHPDGLLGAIWLRTKWVTWFEDYDFVFVQLLAPKNVIRGKLKFRENYTAPNGDAVKLYDVTWRDGATDIMAFLPDRQFFDIKVKGKDFSAKYTVRCRNEEQILAAAREILEAPTQFPIR